MMHVNLIGNEKSKKAKRFVKDTVVFGELAFDCYDGKRGDKVVVNRFFAVQDKHFQNPFMATVTGITGKMKGKKFIVQAFSVTNLWK